MVIWTEVASVLIMCDGNAVGNNPYITYGPH